MTRKMQNQTHAQELVELRMGRPIADVLRDLYVVRGLTQEQVAAEIGVTRMTAVRWLAEYGITRRSEAIA
jgi:DNA-binding XRE family transcriptional regulator